MNWWHYGYLYPPSTGNALFRYVRHGKGGNYAWADGHVSAMPWNSLSKGANGKVDWYYQPAP